MVDIIINKKRLLKRETYSAVASVEMLEGGGRKASCGRHYLEGGVSPFMVVVLSLAKSAS